MLLTVHESSFSDTISTPFVYTSVAGPQFLVVVFVPSYVSIKRLVFNFPFANPGKTCQTVKLRKRTLVLW